MRWSVISAHDKSTEAHFLTKQGTWTTKTDEMETFSSIKEACEAAMNCCQENTIYIRIEFSGYIRDEFNK